MTDLGQNITTPSEVCPECGQLLRPKEVRRGCGVYTAMECRACPFRYRASSPVRIAAPAVEIEKQMEKT